MDLTKYLKKDTNTSYFGGGVSALIEETEEDNFQKAYKAMAIKQGLDLDPNNPLHYYDYRALYKETGKLEPDETGHFPSKYKKEGHPNMIVNGVDTKTGEPIEPKTFNIDKYLKAPSTAEMTQKQDILLKFEDNFQLLDSSITEDYKQYQDYGKQLDDLELQLQEEPEELQWKLTQDYNKIRDLHNTLVNKLQAETAQQKKIFQEYNLVRESFNKDIETYNKWASAKNVEYEKEKALAFQESKKVEPEPIEVPSSQFGIHDLNKPEQMGKIQKGVIGAFGTWEAKKKANPELQKMEDFSFEILSEANKWAEELKGGDWKQSGSSVEQVAIIYERITGEPKEEALTDIKSNKDLNLFFVNPPEKYKEAVKLHRQLEDIFMRTAEPGKDLIGQLGWSGMVAIMGSQAVAGLMEITPKVWKKLTVKVTDKKIPFKEGLDAILKTGHGQGTIYQRKIFDEAVKQADKNNISIANMLKKGLTITDIKPRFAFSGKLYAGLPADEIVKSLVEVGKVTAEAVKGLDPVKVSQVTQQLLNINPALASEFLKAVEKPEAVISKVEITEAPLDIEENELIDMDNKPVELNEDGTITLYHRTTPENAEKIKDTGNFTSKENRNETFFSTKLEGQSIGYGEGVVAVKVKPSSVRLDDAFHKGDISVAVSNKDLSKEVIVPQEAPKAIPKALEPLVGEAKKAKDVEEFIENISKTTRPIREAKVGELVIIKTPTHGGKSATQYNMGIPSQGEIVKINPKTVSVKVGENIYKYPASAKVSALDLTELKGESKEDIADYYNKAVSKAEVKVEPKTIEEKLKEATADLATPVQIKKAHAIANSKAMISEKGKVKPQYRKVAEAMTGVKSIKDMTPEQAEMFIDALNRLPEPKMKNGKLVAPSIPRTMSLVTQDFFKKKYGEPTPIWLLTDQSYYATKLGIKPLVEPFERGKQGFDLEFRLSSNLVDRMIVKLNQIAKTPVQEKLKARVKNIPTKAEGRMAELLNKHEATPSGLTEKEADIFKYFRNLGKDIWRRENEVREKVDLPPIKYKTAYFRHTADAMAKEMLEGKYPFPQGVKYWSEKMVGKKVFNPMEFQRKLSDDLIDLWSKDIRAVTKAMLWNGLKEIYLAQPSKFLNEQLNAISKDLPEYKNLTPAEQRAYEQTKVMPASTKKWLIDYINQVIKGQETELDASLNRIVTKSGLKGLFDKVLSPFGRNIGRKPITNIFSLSGRMIISGVMGWVPRQMIRNAFQQVQNLALYGVNATIKAFLPSGIDKNLKGLLSKSLFMKSYTGFEELPANVMGKLEKVWLYPYGVVANNNAKQGMKAAYWNILELIKNPKFKKYGWADPQRIKDTPKGFLYPSEEEKLLKEMEFGASCTQYQYIPIGMPGVFRYKALIPLTRLQSWWMNYFTKFNKEALHRGFKGRPSWSGEDGPTLPWSRRVNWLKYVIIGGVILTSMGYKKSFMIGVAPTYLSPAGQLALGLYNYAVAGEDWKKEKALKQIYYSWKAFIPGSLAWRDFLAVWNGEKDLEEILFYGRKTEEATSKPYTKSYDTDKYSKYLKSGYDKYDKYSKYLND